MLIYANKTMIVINSQMNRTIGIECIDGFDYTNNRTEVTSNFTFFLTVTQTETKLID
jgi:hypothetical protein